jgi:hypothetical protein
MASKDLAVSHQAGGHQVPTTQQQQQQQPPVAA